MTSAELRFLETVPMYLRDISRTLNEIKEELKRSNDDRKSTGLDEGIVAPQQELRTDKVDDEERGTDPDK